MEENGMNYLPMLAIISPIIVLLISGLWLDHSLEKLKSRLQKSQAIVQKRAEIYSEIQKSLNNIYCYIKRVGKWQEFTPKQIVECKRVLDQEFHATRPFWSKEMWNAYEEFMRACFVTNRGHKSNASIIAEVEKYKELDSWDDRFTDYYHDGFSESKLDEANDNLMNALSKDFGVE